jgi:hypothetical protein
MVPSEATHQDGGLVEQVWVEVVVAETSLRCV